MGIFHCLLAMVFFSFTLCLGSVAKRRNDMETDQLALLEIRAKISGDPMGIMGSWNTSVHFCQWPGVTCGKRHRRVTQLNLSSQHLQGSISSYVGNLSFLQALQLQSNSFSQEIPPEIGHLRRLKMLLLNQNLLTGEIPANISGCSSLTYLFLDDNKLVGRIPTEFSALSNIRIISMAFNNLTGGIPPFFGNFSSLEVLETSSNNFGGSIPESLGRLKKLYFLSMGENMLSGIIPPSLYNLSSINVFCFPLNQLHGTLPSHLGNTFPNLVVFNVGDNKFTGSIPFSLSNASNLEGFTIAINGFTGTVPSLEKLQKLRFLSISTNNLGTGRAGDLSFFSTVSNATSLELVSISANNFGGPLPSSIANFTSLGRLTMDENQISGNIPTGLGNLVNLEQLDMRSNRLTGEIPEEIGKLKLLKKLNLAQNNFLGNIPASFGNLTLLTDLNIQQNVLSGSIPLSLGNCKNLLSLDLSRNNLSGEIPGIVMNITSLTIYVGLSHNYLIGSLPTEVGALANLGVLDISHNMLTGRIPASLASCVRLESLHLQNNFFQGSIPSSFSSLKGIQALDFSDNNLTGKIPDFLKDFHLLLSLNLSHNDFEGTVPTEGVFMNSSATSVAGNAKLCGGIAEFKLPLCNLRQIKKGRLTLALKLIIAASGLLCATLVLFSLFLLLVRRKRAMFALSSPVIWPFRVSYQSLLKATGGFSSTNLLGEGGFGSVYKGILDRNGTVVAVKVLNLFHPVASKSFKAECKVLRNIRHRNLVKLLTACSGIDYQGKDFKALVYEFMVNGSLEEWLHPTPGSNETNESPRSLNLLQRVSIAIDVASALEYLHHGCHTPIVHCDLKPSNVLLNENLEGRVGDFGLSRFFSGTAHDFSGSQTSSIGIRGTIGYAPPEYGTGNRVSTSGDVYAYGILLLEMFTGKRPTDEMIKDGLSLHSYAKAALPEQVENILDPILLQEINDEETNNHEVVEHIVSIFELGAACSAQLPSERPNISVVTADLSTIKKKLLGRQRYPWD